MASPGNQHCANHIYSPSCLFIAAAGAVAFSRCQQGMWSRMYVTVGCPSVRLSVPSIKHSSIDICCRRRRSAE